jgi:hypothetical protein
MATRLNYVLPILRQFARSNLLRLSGDGLRARLRAPSRERPFVVVTGGGRSGTSAVARVLHESGVRMGSDFDEPNERNETGFFEDRRVSLINQEMLTEMGLTSIERQYRWAWRSTVLAVAERYASRMAALADAPADGWKDPIFNITLEGWLPYLPQPLKLVICLRSPEAYARSVMNVYGLTDADAVMRLWARQYQRLLDIVRDYQLDAMCIEYETLLRAPERAIAALAGFVGQPLDASGVESTLRRFAGSVPATHQALYDAVRQLGGAVDSSADVSIAELSHATSSVAGSHTRDHSAGAIAAIDQRVTEANAVWTAALGFPDPPLAAPQPLAGDALERARTAAAAYAATLVELQRELFGFDAPKEIVEYHRLVLERVNHERIVAELVVQALVDEPSSSRKVKTAMKAWRGLTNGPAAERARQERERLREQLLVDV